MPRIIASVINDLETDQRVHKVCTTLNSMGFEVLLIGRLTSASGQLKRKYETKRMRLFFSKGPFFYAEYNIRLFILLLFNREDVLLSNDLDTLLANYLVSKLKGKPLVYDSHEYFTEVPELQGRRAKWFWEKLEARLIPKLKTVLTVNDSLANIYSNKYGIDVSVIRNLPHELEHENNTQREYLLYQGAINEGRGLESLILAMKHIHYPLKIIGNGDIKDKIQELIQQQQLNDRVELIDRVSPEQLRRITLKARVGFNLLEEYSLNYKFSLANKFFDYMQSEVPIITMKFPEYQQIFMKYDMGKMVEDLDPEKIANAISHLLKEDVFEEKLKALRAAKKEFTWEKEVPKLKRIFAQF